VLPANRVDASGRKGGGNVVVSAKLKTDVTGRKNCNRCGNETGKYLLEQSGRREKGKERKCRI
jgi:uncharacterized ferredoxin-like protein